MGKITVAVFEALLSLTDEERRALAGLMAADELTVDKLSAGLSQALQDEARQHSKENQEQAEALRKIPAGVWAAHALAELSELIYNLSVIQEAAEAMELSAGADSYAEEGRYKMLVEAVAGIAGRMMDIITDQGSARDVLQLVAEETKKTAEE